MRAIRLGTGGSVRRVQFAPDGGSIAAVVGERLVRYEFGRTRPEYLHGVGLTAVVSPDFQLMAAPGVRGGAWEVQLFPLTGGLPVGVPSGGLPAVGFAAGGAELVAHTPQGVRRWDVRRLDAVAPLPALRLPDGVGVVRAFAEAGVVLAAGGQTERPGGRVPAGPPAAGVSAPSPAGATGAAGNDSHAPAAGRGSVGPQRGRQSVGHGCGRGGGRVGHQVRRRE